VAPALNPSHAVDGWVPAGLPVEVAGLVIPGGLLYVGPHLTAVNGCGVDPALIDPRLSVARDAPDWLASSVGYWPSYSEISSQARAAYLVWQAGGRREPNVPISWPFLFFYGLERRVLVDASRDERARREIPAIRAEVERLLGLYGMHASFRGYASSFLDLIRSAEHPEAVLPPASTTDRWNPPLSLRVGLGRFSATGTPVPPEWALAWVRWHPDIYPRTPATRCPEEYEALFHTRYTTAFGAGLTIRATTTTLTHSYQPASSGLDSVDIRTSIPDVFTDAEATSKLTFLTEDCTSALDAYSRYLGRRPEARGTLPAIALLPGELIPPENAELSRLRKFVEGRLAGVANAVVEAAELVARWPRDHAGTFTKADAVGLAQILATQGVGMEPDVRFGGPALPGRVAVVFRLRSGDLTAPSAAYAASAMLLHLAVAVSLADGNADDAETTMLSHHLETAMHLSEPEQTRLQAHLQWLLAGEVKLAGLTKRLTVVDPGDRAAMGDFLVSVAAADGVVSPAEITTLTKIFKLLDLDPASIHPRAHQASMNQRPATEPVTIRTAARGSSGYRIPSRPGPTTLDSAPPPGPVRLDEAAIAAKLAETMTVSALLSTVFTDDEEPPPSPPDLGLTDPAGTAVPGLDAGHSQLFTILVTRTQWTRAELEGHCAQFALLPDGAIDTLNEAAYERAGDPLTDGEDPIAIDVTVAQEMLA
jgi:uncharacterized tellurite resistance protein B-like protein